MKPKPFASLNHLTLPVVRIPAPGRESRRRLNRSGTTGGSTHCGSCLMKHSRIPDRAPKAGLLAKAYNRQEIRSIENCLRIDKSNICDEVLGFPEARRRHSAVLRV